MARRNRLPIGEVINVIWDCGGPPDAHYVYGHVTDEEFWDAMRGYHMEPEIDALKRDFCAPYHAHYRTRPPTKYEDDFGYIFIFDCPPGRGAAKVTAITRLRENPPCRNP